MLIFNLWGYNLEVSIINIDVDKNRVKNIEVLSLEYSNNLIDVDQIIAEYLS